MIIRLANRTDMAVFVPHILHVYRMISNKQMMRIDAYRIVAFVKNLNCRPNEHLAVEHEGNSVGEHTFPFKVEIPITVALRSRFPTPALVLRGYFNTLPKMSNRIGYLFHA